MLYRVVAQSLYQTSLSTSYGRDIAIFIYLPRRVLQIRASVDLSNSKDNEGEHTIVSICLPWTAKKADAVNVKSVSYYVAPIYLKMEFTCHCCHPSS